MEKRMNKQDLIELINTLKLNKEEFWIICSGALVLRDLLPNAGDLDIAVTNVGMEELRQNYELTKLKERFYSISDNIECVDVGKKIHQKYQPEKIGDIYVQNIFDYLEYLEASNRQKDQDRIPMVKQYIKEYYELSK